MEQIFAVKTTDVHEKIALLMTIALTKLKGLGPAPANKEEGIAIAPESNAVMAYKMNEGGGPPKFCRIRNGEEEVVVGQFITIPEALNLLSRIAVAQAVGAEFSVLYAKELQDGTVLSEPSLEPTDDKADDSDSHNSLALGPYDVGGDKLVQISVCEGCLAEYAKGNPEYDYMFKDPREIRALVKELLKLRTLLKDIDVTLH